MQCVEASNAEDALCKMVTNPSDIAILDIKMPGKSGIELLQEMKTLYPKTAVIMITAVNDIGTVTRCMKAGAADYIPKPFDSEEVWLSVQHTLEKRKLEIEIDSYRQDLENQVEVQDVQIRQVFLGAIE